MKLGLSLDTKKACQKIELAGYLSFFEFKKIKGKLSIDQRIGLRSHFGS
jgi:hypothetical protein